VLVVESSGKQKSVERIGLVLRVLSQGRPQEGGSTRRRLLDPLTRRAGSLISKRDGQRRAVEAACRKARGARRRGAGVTPSTRAKRCAGVTLERNREGMTSGSVRRREASGVHG